jgi:hypothetical protein
MKIYLKYKLYSLKKLVTWWYLYLLLFFVAIYYSNYYVAFLSLIVLGVIAIYDDYKSGRHIDWYRKMLKEKMLKERYKRGGVNGQEEGRSQGESSCSGQ